ncbi:MAG: protein translocase subunit SecD [Treponema sp.]|jgi:preprotein translocase subunit SecD|nr:protein translocase subunit SecD [Treponema sp.]
MSKKYRFFIILAVLGVCFLFLWPTLRWYYFIPEDQKALALQTREQIRTYAQNVAIRDYERIMEAARSNEAVPGGMEYLTAIAKKSNKRPQPETWTARTVLETFYSREEVRNTIEKKYSDEVFALKALHGKAVKLGLDLSGGLSIVLQANFESLRDRLGRSPNDEDKSNAMESALGLLNTRIDSFGLTEPVIRLQGSEQIYIEIPGTADPELINDIIMGKGSLAFHLLDAEATESFNSFYRANPAAALELVNGRTTNPFVVPDDAMILGVYDKDRYGLDEQARNSDGSLQYIAVKREIGLDGNHIINSSVDRDNIDGRPLVVFNLSSEGGNIFYDLTLANIGKSLAIVLDGKVRSYPRINQGISGGSGSISGFGADEAHSLALILRTAALPVELEVINQQSIGASMGEDTIRQGLYALLGGIAAVFVFMLIYYKTAGINAIIAQLLNFYIMFSVLSALGFTLTLPAIAGFILTIGMATDANVLIFERMKEEIRLGKSRKAVVEAGFSKAFWAIMDSNITTFIAAIFLSMLGSGPIRGFAITLSIGVFSSVFTSLFVSRLIFDFGTDVFRTKNVSVSWFRIQSEAAKGIGS